MAKIQANEIPTERMSDITSGKNEPYWFSTAKPASFEPLKENITADVIVIGGGIAGLTTAYFLAKAGKKVVVVEDGLIGSGETGRTTAHLTWALDNRYFSLHSMHGKEKAKLAAESHQASIDQIEKIIEEENISCDFQRVNGYLFLHPSDEKDALQKEYSIIQDFGFTNIQLTTETMTPSLYAGEQLVFPNQAQFHPLKYLNGLAMAIQKYGGKVYTKTHAESVEAGKITSKEGHTIHAPEIVIATNSPVHTSLKYHGKQAAYRTYVIAAPIPKGKGGAGLYWDTGDHQKPPFYPYHYVRTHPHSQTEDMLIIGGDDHKTGHEEDARNHFSVLEKWARSRFPDMGIIQYYWSGQVLEPVDGLAYLGKDRDHMYVLTGDSGNGITHGTLGGMLVSDMIMGRKNEWEEVYEPSRLPLSALGPLAQETADVVVQYGKGMMSGKNMEVDKIRKGTGKIINEGTRKLAVYRNDSGELFIRSAVCPHQGCIVEWNESEKTYDCPCHGSRFSAEGKVLNGPANSDLKEEKV